MVAGPDLVIATSFCTLTVVVADVLLLVLGVSTVAVSVVLMTAELISDPAAVAGKIAATICNVFTLAPEAKLPMAKMISSGFAATVSDAVGGTVTAVPFNVALMTRMPSGMLSATCTLIASEGPLFVAVIV